MEINKSAEVCFRIFFVLLLMTVGSASAVSTQLVDSQLALKEVQITNNESEQGIPDIYGDRIVWTDWRNGDENQDIYMYDISTSKETRLTTNGENQVSPDIYGDRVVWTDFRNGNEDIYMYDFSTSKETQITTYKADQGDPAIYGDRIVWVDDRSGNSDIYVYNLSTSKETQITNNEADQYSPAIYGNMIVWEDKRNGNSDIYVYDLSASRETQITTNKANQKDPAIYGDRIVWEDERNGGLNEDGDIENADIYMYNLSTSKEIQITTNEARQWEADIYGNRIVWTDYRNGWNIYMYDLSTSREIEITTIGSSYGPKIYGDRIVGNDGRNGLSDIYMFTISEEWELPVANFSSNVTSGYAPLTVLFTDLSENATSRTWDFQNDGKIDSRNKNQVYKYTFPGNYTVKLTAINENGTDSELSTITVSVKPIDSKPILTVTQITTNESWQDLPAIYGNRIVWTDARNGVYDIYGNVENLDIYMYDISTKKETQITTNESNQSLPAIYGDKIVWVDDRNGNADIYMYDISTKKETQITKNKSAQDEPAIYDNRIVWTDYRNDKSGFNSDIYMYDLSTSKETQITTNEFLQWGPSIYGNRIVWTDYRNGQYEAYSQVYMYDISTSRETQINNIGSYASAIYGDRIIWVALEMSDIYMYDISTSTEIQITSNESGKADPAIYGDRIIWVDTRNGGIENTDIYMYDLSTFKETQISTNNSQELSPEIYGNRIVWVDTHNWHPKSDIYMCTISGESPAPKLPVADFTCNTTSGYALLAVQFTDFSQNATSRTWDFENDGKVDSTNKTEVHVYRVPGNYTVKLTAKNENGTASKSTTINVIKKSQPISPIANFTCNVTGGYAPLVVQFTDLSHYATSRTWDFENDGKADSMGETEIHVFTNPGTYIVNLIVINENGMSSKQSTINVIATNDASGDNGGKSRSSGGSSGGGGVGGSPEPAKNVEVKELAKAFITNGKTVKFDFTKNATCVVYVSFDAKKNAGKTTATVEMLKGKSTLVSKLPEGEVYKSFNIWVGNSGFATSKNIENPVVCFKVEKAWAQEKNIDPASITLNRYSEKKWVQFSPSLLEEDNKFLYFTAKVPEFSPFAITGKTKETMKNKTKMQPEMDTGMFDKNDTENTGPEIKQEAEQKESSKTPGFEIIYGVICLLALFLNKKR